MPKTRPPYAPEFRRQMVDLVRAGRDPAELAREFEPTAQSISHWVAQADRQEGRREEKGNGLSAAEREELACKFRSFRQAISVQTGRRFRVKPTGRFGPKGHAVAEWFRCRLWRTAAAE